MATFPARKGETIGEDEANRWALSVREREKRECGARLVRWLLGWSGSWVGPVAAFLFFCFVITFSFLFSGLLYNFFI
jgi:hypothetical protein